MPVPRWYNIFTDILSEDKNPTYSLSTALTTSSGILPRSRSVIHRAIVSPSSSRPLLLTTTDIRSPKAHQLHANPNSEATFWFSEPKVQFRIVASTYLLPQSSHPWHVAFPARELAGAENARFDWDQERLITFDSISGHLRATFLRPVPGTPMASYEEGMTSPVTVATQGEEKDEQEKRVVDEALANFALVVLDPSEFECLELDPIPNRRTKWTKKADQWEEQILVP